MIESGARNYIEPTKVVLVRISQAMPCDYIKQWMILLGLEQIVVELDYRGPFRIVILFECSSRSLKIAGICQSVRSYGP